MEICEEKAEIILSSLGDKDGEITDEELKLEKRIRQEFPVINEWLKKSEHRNHLWKCEVEDDKRVKEARRKLDEHTKNDFYTILDDLMKMKKVVLHELLEKEIEQ